MSDAVARLSQLSPAKRRLLEQELLRRRREPASGTAPPLAATVEPHLGRALPCSFAQQRLWFLHQLDPARPAYNMPFPLRLGGELDSAALRGALTEIVRRHESLRTVFAPGEDGPVQLVHPPCPVPLLVVDLSGLESGCRESELGRLVAEDARLPFSLERGPLLRASLLRLGRDDHALLLSLHHIVADGWSQGVLEREMMLLYGGGPRHPSPLPELPLQYADFAVWQRGWLRGRALEAL